MLVSAIPMCEFDSMCDNVPFSYHKQIDQIGDTSFNSLSSYTGKITPREQLPMLFDNINMWKNFCNSRIMGQKLNIIA